MNRWGARRVEVLHFRRGRLRHNSRLIRFAAPEPLPGRVRCAGCTQSYEIWDGRKLELIPPELWGPSAPPPEEARALVEHVRAEEEPPVLATYAPAVLRPTWDRLVITAENGTRQVFADDLVQDDLRSIHRFAGTRDPLPAYVVVRQYVPEGGTVLMVDRRTGAVTKLDAPPSPSPDGKRFATASLDLVAGHSPNRIRIYRMEADRPVVEWEIEPREWGAQNPVWLDENTVQMDRGVVDWNTHELRTSPLIVRREPAGWAAQPSPEHARDALLAFLSALGQRMYIEASQYYGGSYEQHRTWNPELDAEDLPSLWRAACETNGLQCLGRAEVLHAEPISPTEVRFRVRLFTKEGEPFVLGPCCGETEETMPPQREFAFTVRKVGEQYLVVSLPPYMP